MIRMHRILWAWALVATLFLSACATEPFDYQRDNDGIQGPGVLSGADGLLTIIGPPPTTDPAPTTEKSKTPSEKR